MKYLIVFLLLGLNDAGYLEHREEVVTCYEAVLPNPDVFIIPKRLASIELVGQDEIMSWLPDD